MNGTASPADLSTGVVYSGIVVGSSVSEPSFADEINYTVSINVAGGNVTFEGVVPQPGARQSDYDGEPLRLFPFILGHRVPIHVERQGGELRLWIDRGESSAYASCTNGGTP